MKCFHLRRFGLVLRLDLLSGWKRNLRYVASLYAGCLAIEFANFYGPSRNGLSEHYLRLGERACPGQPDAALAAAERGLLADNAPAFVAFLGFVLTLAASAAFENLRTKGGRTAYLTLPATNTEKYLSRLLWATVGAVIAFWIAFVAADVTRMALFPILGHGYGSTVPYVFHELTHFFSPDGYLNFHMPDATEYLLGVAFLAELLLLFHAVYLLCGTLLRRHPYLLTTLGLIALGALTVALIDLYAQRLERIPAFDPITLLAVIDGVLFAAIVACYALSYRSFCRIQVVRHKWRRR